MQIGLFLLICFIISMVLALRLKHKVTRIFSVAAICCFFLVASFTALIPSSEVNAGHTTFVASLVVIGIIFVAIVLINIFFQNLSRNKINKVDSDKDP